MVTSHKRIKEVIDILSRENCGLILITPDGNEYLIYSIDRLKEANSISYKKYRDDRLGGVYHLAQSNVVKRQSIRSIVMRASLFTSLTSLLTVPTMSMALLSNISFNVGFPKLPRESDLYQQVKEETKEIARKIAREYNVHITILKTDEEFWAESTFRISLKNKIYFISDEHPVETSMAVRYLLDYKKHQLKVSQQKSMDTRSEKASSFATNLEEIIREIRDSYAESNEGKAPSIRKIIDILNERQIPPPNGDKWYTGTLHRVIERNSKRGKD